MTISCLSLTVHHDQRTKDARSSTRKVNKKGRTSTNKEQEQRQFLEKAMYILDFGFQSYQIGNGSSSGMTAWIHYPLSGVDTRECQKAALQLYKIKSRMKNSKQRGNIDSRYLIAIKSPGRTPSKYE